METTIREKTEKFSESILLKAIIIGVLILLLLIPGAMIQGLIGERQNRSKEAIQKMNDKWSAAQTLSGPVLAVPYLAKETDDKKNIITVSHTFYLTPEQLSMKVNLTPEERHYGIYKAILYKSEVAITGKFTNVDSLPVRGEIQWKDAYLQLGISDLRGVSEIPDFVLNNAHFTATAGNKEEVSGQALTVSLKNLDFSKQGKELIFSGTMKLKGSTDINFIPIGKTTDVEVAGKWNSPGFIGSFTPEYRLTNGGFTAKWNVLHFNRNIPEFWSDNSLDFGTTSFGVSLVNTVDHYQLNMRSAKYAIMFVALTFLVFFFVEIITRKKIHPIQYSLVGFALILFYSLLLSLSEQIGFGVSYLIAAVAIIGLITVYAHSIFKNKTQTALLAVLLGILYVFLYVVLQLEDIALLIGSIGLFIILGVIMFVSRKIKWYKSEESTAEIPLPKVNQSAKEEFLGL